MYNILIADDEPAVCEGLSVLIDWEKYGFYVANTAEDGEDALEKLGNGRYNLIITDIRMPVLDGLELLKTIKEQNSSVKILIISGYSDFNYAQRAIEYGVKGYLLKPVDRDDLMEHIVKIKEELDNENINTKSLRENLNLAKDKLLLDFVSGNLTGNTINEKTSSVGINIKSEYYYLALIEINNFSSMVDKNLDDANIIKFGIRNIVEEIVNERKLGYVYEDSYGVLGILFCGDGQVETETYKDAVAILEYIRENILKFVNIAITIGYGSLVKSPLQVRNSRKQAQFALQKGILSGDKKILGYYEKDLSENHLIKMNWDSSRLLEAVEFFDKRSIEAEINFYFDQIMNCQVTNGILQAMLYNFIFAICTIIRKYNGDIARIFSRNEIYELDNCKIFLGNMREWLFQKSNETCDYIVELQRDKSSNIINQIKDYIDGKYSEDLSIKSIAGIFYLSPAYLGRLFKNSTGEAFSDYLNKVRISKVKKMILSEDSKIYEIINKVGYNNHEHFYRQFKRYAGMSFAEYKETIRR